MSWKVIQGDCVEALVIRIIQEYVLGVANGFDNMDERTFTNHEVAEFLRRSNDLVPDELKRVMP